MSLKLESDKSIIFGHTITHLKLEQGFGYNMVMSWLPNFLPGNFTKDYRKNDHFMVIFTIIPL